MSDVDSDDVQIGRVLSRREVLALMGGTALLACAPQSLAPPPSLTGSPTTGAASSPVSVASPAGSVAVPACVVRPEQTEGPFFVDAGLERSDIRSDPSTGRVSAGAPLALAFNVVRVSGASCAPLAEALVDVWQCDALGVYSDVGAASGQRFLRGHQGTDKNGRAAFTTVYPGWYGGRTVHIHFKIRWGYSGFTSQLYFDDAFTDQVFQQPPYAQRGQRSTRNSGDSLFRSGGQQLLLTVTPSGTGYAAAFDIGLAT